MKTFKSFLKESYHKPNKQELIKVMIFTVDHWNHGCKSIALTFIRKSMRENWWLLKDSLELQRIKYINAWLLYQKHMHMNKLPQTNFLVEKCNNTIHRIKPVDVKSDRSVDFSLDFDIKPLNLRLVIISEFQSMKAYSQKAIQQVWQGPWLWFKN